MNPTPHRFVPRGIVDLIDRLGPGALATGWVQCSANKGATPLKSVYFCIFVLPILPPVLDHHGLRLEPVFVQKVHDDDVLQTDELRLIDHYVNALGAPALVGRSGLVALGKAHRLDKIKAGAVVARHS